MRKVLAGRYEAPAQRAQAWQQGGWRTRARDSAAVSEARVGIGPLASAFGARVKPAALERIRAREELRASGVTNVTHKEKAS